MGRFPTHEENQGLRLALLGTDRYSRAQAMMDGLGDTLERIALERVLRTGQLTRQVVTSIAGLPKTTRVLITEPPPPPPIEFEEEIHLIAITLGLASAPAGTAAASGPFFFPYIIEEVVFSAGQTGLTVAASVDMNLIISGQQRNGALTTGFGNNPGDSIFHPDSNNQLVRLTEQMSTVTLHPHKLVTTVPTTLIFEAVQFGGDDLQPSAVVRIRQIAPEEAHERIAKIPDHREPPGLTIVPPDIREELLQERQADLLSTISKKLDRLKTIETELKKRPPPKEITIRESSDKQKALETKLQRRELLELTGRELCLPFPRTIRFLDGVELPETGGILSEEAAARVKTITESRLEGIRRLHACLLRNPMGIPHKELLANGFDEDMIASSWQLSKSGSSQVISMEELAARERDVTRRRELQEEEIKTQRAQQEALKRLGPTPTGLGAISGFV